MAAYSVTGESFVAEKPRSWSDGRFSGAGVGVRNLDLHPDGKRFAVLKDPAGADSAGVTHVTLVFNFFEELRRKASKVKP